ncbi:MAG: hypothetical protein EBX40_07840, partial [Gammaproteobacteria bacterium]|nr:hypothetical protein [Gammaproteobacteria bacterium]
GTRIEMNAAGATTVTVNTGLFSAGDTLFIQNIGAGACTVTAGTATVNKATAGSLTLSQYQGGTLYFVSASSAIFFADAGYTPPLTTKGDLFGYDTAAARIPIGSNNQVLTADSTQALGLKWATPSGAQNYSLLGTGTTTSGSTVTVSGISGQNQLIVLLKGVSGTGIYSEFTLRLNSDSGSNYDQMRVVYNPAGTYAAGALYSETATSGTSIRLAQLSGDATVGVSGYVTIFGCNTAGKKLINQSSSGSAGTSNNQIWYTSGAVWNNTATVSSVSLLTNSGTFDAGSFEVYGSA